jgi:hypothetical protein
MGQQKPKREYAAERRERLLNEQQQAQAQEWADFGSQYLPRLLDLVYEYGADPELSVVRKDPGQFAFSHQENSWKDAVLPVMLPEQMDRQLMWEFNQLQDEVAYLQQQRQLAEEKWRRKQSALSKLSAEERELLGLN